MIQRIDWCQLQLNRLGSVVGRIQFMGKKNSNGVLAYVTILVVGLTIYSIGTMCYAESRPELPCPIRITSIVIDPEHSDTIYFSRKNNGGGVYKTTDGGANWRKVYKILNIEGPMTIDTKTPNIVYAGYIRSTDSGENWSHMGNSWIIPSVYELVINPHNPAILYIAALEGLYKSNDSGKTWTAISDKKLGICRAFAIDASNPEVLYAYFGKAIRNTYGNVAGTTGEIYKSVDSGANWTSIMPTTDITKLIVDPSNTAIIYAGTIQQGIYRSVDGGKQWENIKQGLPAQRQVSVLVIDPVNPKMIYAGTDVGVFISTDRGDNWRSASTGLPKSVAVQALAVNPKNTNIIYAGTWGYGIYKSIDGGEKWEPVNTGIPCDDYESSKWW